MSTPLTQLGITVGRVAAVVDAADQLAQLLPWTPPEWRKGALFSITVPATEQVSSNVTDGSGNSLQTAGQGAATNKPSKPTVYVFDAILKADLHHELRHTEHPIQTSASSPVGTISDHAYGLPARVLLEVGMSDAMMSFSGSTKWTGASTKSVSAFQTLLALQESRTLVTLATRLKTYSNMIISGVLPSDTHRTLHGLRATVVFTEIFMASVTAVSSSLNTSSDDTSNPLSTDPQTTGATAQGTVQPTSVPATVTSQNSVTPSTSVPGAGGWSSVNSSLNQGG